MKLVGVLPDLMRTTHDPQSTTRGSPQGPRLIEVALQLIATKIHQYNLKLIVQSIINKNSTKGITKNYTKIQQPINIIIIIITVKWESRRRPESSQLQRR